MGAAARKVEAVRFVGFVCAIWFLFTAAYAVFVRDPFDGASLWGIDVWLLHQGALVVALMIILGYLMGGNHETKQELDLERLAADDRHWRRDEVPQLRRSLVEKHAGDNGDPAPWAGEAEGRLQQPGVSPWS